MKKSALSLVDDFGQVFIDDNVIYRGINEDYEEISRNLLECGLIDELVNNGLFPKTKISEKELAPYSLVLEHEKIETITYPYEWSFTMLQDAALLLLKVNKIASKYNYHMKDANPYNVLFKHTQPVFIDFGSFCKIKNSKQYWSALDEFRKSFFYPLSIYSWGAEFTSRKIIHSYYTSISDSEYLLLKYRFLRIFNKKYLDKLCRYYFGSKRLAHVSEEKFARFSGLKFAILKFLRKICLLFPTKFNYEREVRKILKLKPSFSTEWGAYHQIHFYNDDGNITLSERMKAVVDIIKKYKPEKIMELAGNQGVLSGEIAKMDFVYSVLCTDYDEHAIDVLYQNEKSQNSKISPVLINFMQPLVSDVTEHPCKRFRSDMVIALAVTHHLILRQKYNLDHILDLISQYTNRYLLIEFMPLGLFDGKYAPPIPEWYTLTWFRECILKKFEILSEHDYEENRHLIVAKKKSC